MTMTTDYYERMTELLICGAGRLECYRGILENQTEGAAESWDEKWLSWKREGSRLFECGNPEPFEYLARLSGLDDFERFCLAALVVSEMDPSLAFRLERFNSREGGRLCIFTLMSLYAGQDCFFRRMVLLLFKGQPFG